MPRVKGAVHARKKRRSLLAQVKGYRFASSKKERAARTAWLHAGVHAFAHRRDKKNDFRRLWQIRIGAAARARGLSYSRFMAALKKKEIVLNRKMLAALAVSQPGIFDQLTTAAKS